MRDVRFVKEHRDALKEERHKFVMAKERLFPYPTTYRDISQEERPKLSYIIQTLRNLDIQINALEFVLNEDTHIQDATEHFAQNNFTKEDLFEEDSKSCPCYLCEKKNGKDILDIDF